MTKERIVEIIANYTGTPFEKMILRRRDNDVLYPRQLTMYFLKKYVYKMSKKDIGIFFKSKTGVPFDHSTVINAIRKINGFIDIKDEIVIRDVYAISEIIGKEMNHFDDTKISMHIDSIIFMLNKIPNYAIPACLSFGELAEVLSKRNNKNV